MTAAFAASALLEHSMDLRQRSKKPRRFAAAGLHTVTERRPFSALHHRHEFKTDSGRIFASRPAHGAEYADSQKDQGAYADVQVRHPSLHGPPDDAGQKNDETDHVKREGHGFSP
jgi:hypothetical protein